MTRSLVGMAAAVALTCGPSVVAAQSVEEPRVQVTRTDEHVTVAVTAATLTVTQQLTPTRFRLTVADGRDVARFSGDVQGRVRIERAGRTLAISMTSATPEDLAAARTLLAGSIALQRFDRLMASTWARTAKLAVVFASAHAIVSLMQGDIAPHKAFVERVQKGTEPRLTTVAQYTAGQCWAAYERDAVQYTYDLQVCMQEAANTVNPLATAWCAYSYNLKASLAFIWLLNCSGW